MNDNESLEIELESVTQSSRKAENESKIRVQECLNCPDLIERIEYFTSTLSKLTLGRSNLEVALGSQRRVINKQVIGYTGKSNKINARKFSDIIKPSYISCFYCNNISHLSNACYCKNVGVPKGKFKWILMELQ